MISVRTKIVSQRINIPELDNYIGKDVIITIDEDLDEKNMKDFFDCISNVEIDIKSPRIEEFFGNVDFFEDYNYKESRYRNESIG